MDGRTSVEPPARPAQPPRRPKAKKAAPPRVLVPVELPPEEPLFDKKTLAIGLLLALVLMPPVLVSLLQKVPIAAKLLPQVVEFTLIEPPEPEPEPPTPPPPPEPKKPKQVDMKEIDAPIPTQSTPEPSEEPPKPVFGVTMESTTAGPSSFQVRVGNTLQKEPEDEVTDPKDVKPLRQVSFTRLSDPPRILRDFRAEYPEGPRAEGIEGTVLLKLTIDETGHVTAVTVVRGVHPELDAAAKAAAFRFVFAPGIAEGEAVITTGYVYRYTWLIED